MPDVVVIGFDMTLTYEEVGARLQYIRNGAVFLATHLDINCPTKDGFIPDCGAMCAAISLSTGKEPKYVGKPFKGDRGYGSGDDQGKARGNVVCRRPDLHGCENRRGKWGTRNPGADRRDEAGGCTEGGCRAGCDFHRAERDGRNTQDYERRGKHRMTMLELLEESPIIAAIKSWEGLEKSLKSECKVVFVLFGTICDIDQIVARIKDAGKVAIVHVDMIQGLSTKRVAVDFIAHNTRADGIISTKNTLVERAKEMGLYAIQRTFVVDSIAP